MKAKMMKKALVIPMVAAAAIVMTSVSALALDRAQGSVQRVDTTANEFTIAVDGTKKQHMTFKVSASKFDELALDVNDRLVVEYDKAECAGKADCVAKASKVDRQR